MNENLGSLDMAQEIMSQTDSLGSTLDEPRNICHDKALSILQINHAKMRVQRREMIIGNLRTCIGNA